MRANRGTKTRPEDAVASALWRAGYRYRRHHRIKTATAAVRPDIVLTRKRLAIFVDGCFWHRCPTHGVSPKVNSGYWTAKLDRNVERDAYVRTALAAEGWSVLRVWEHDDPADVLIAVRKVA
jgi:DNA mismatch endonuclease, patch repair protein